MSEQLDSAVDALTSTFTSLDLIARALVVDAKEVFEAMASCENQDTAEYIALCALAKYNPYTAPTRTNNKTTEE